MYVLALTDPFKPCCCDRWLFHLKLKYIVADPQFLFPFQIFQEIGAVQSLKRIVMYSSNATVCALAKRALSMMGEEVPKRILSSVPNWKTCEVQTWLQQIGFSACCDRFQVSDTLFLQKDEISIHMFISQLSLTAALTWMWFGS